MKARGKNTIYALTLLMIVYLLLPTCMTYAAPAAAQKSTQQAQPAAAPASSLLNPNAPPKGTITIPASSKDNINASTWYTGSYQFIQWTCNGTRSNLVDVTLWQNNQNVVVIGTGIATGKTAYTVPTNMAAGIYELRVTSEDDTRVEARQPVTVVLASITVTAPTQNEVLYPSSKYTIKWTYTGNPGTVKLSLKQDTNITYDSNYWPASLSAVTASMGGGSAVWTLPDQRPVGGSGSFRIIVTSTDNPAISAFSDFTMSCNKLTSDCSGYCVNLQTDYGNCGYCGNSCEKLGTWTYDYVSGKEYPAAWCGNGQCRCIDNFTLCGGKCVNFGSDPLNCGKCGNQCGPNWQCNGSCVCKEPYTICGNACTNLLYDAKNCWKCGNVCPPSTFCVVGQCQ